ncbi:ribonuclease P protein subunit RPR2 [Cryptococcus deuterogattii 99/473]|uniref:Ribonuclease P protein subunit RPR2 n=2 Tax=Cryptococcus deuterogattii TaxID=1859096 RepID=A0A0D0UXD7_9TREE|nr:ribonuclease P protein subunit RPR2 [Cryptococcus deuterogattii R265]KIR27104.1 ribonuclease P protein subunit RPR2 [Cryptococcus deuterogattii LA55]KIR31948.1 ribonuclease P protein subunit RPR2 [Cryptococcus deuterogattii MMRL2647]KIR39966.1 ribonuclease P protein subunit RPR2 [Cryptococcus deuterogattii Ram5]KIR71360.1 ribonuclease P protein subunit RPR2 [Cryptococcus deuterogattii CA1014]KIR90939.1 ribonuclease P protein subunit RPR2 [Cryptococcus deuterogattii CBS 10090]KIR96307.1 rib
MDNNRSSTSKSNQANQSKQNNPKNQPQALKQPAQPQILNKDLFQRINYTYQAAIFLQNIGVDAGPSSSISKRDEDVHVVMDRKGKRRVVELKGGQEAFKKLARMSMRETKTMVVHNQLKLDPSLKRSICRVCSTVLIPGLTSRIRNRPNLNTFTNINQTCLTCCTVLSIPSPPVALHKDPTESAVTQDRGSLDGPVRAVRREKIARRSKPAFHEHERRDEGTKGHVLWRGEEKLGGWGVYKHVEEGIVQQNDGEDMKQTAPNA